MTSGTLVTLTNTTTGRHGCREEYVQPWVIDRVEPWRTGLNGGTILGARVTLDDETVLLVAEPPEEVRRRVDAAQEAAQPIIRTTPSIPQRVVVTNWMAQLWVLLVANLLLDLVFGDRVRQIGDLLFGWRP